MPTDPLSIWLVVAGMGAITYALRLSLVLLLERVGMPLLIRQALRFVPPAVLSALIFPELLRPAGALEASLGNPRLIAGSLAALVAWRTKNVMLTIGTGMGALWILQYGGL